MIESKGRVPEKAKATIMKERARKERAVLSDAKKKQRSLVKQTKHGIKIRSKQDLFIEQFLKNGGNATEAALAVFDCKSRESASTVGSYYLRKAKELGRIYLDHRQMGMGKLIDHAVGRMLESESPEWWDRVARISGYWDLSDGKKVPSIVNVVQSEKSILSKYIQDADLLEDIGEDEVEGNEAEAENTNDK